MKKQNFYVDALLPQGWIIKSKTLKCGSKVSPSQFSFINFMRMELKKLILFLCLINSTPLYLIAQTEPIVLENQLQDNGRLNVEIYIDNTFTDNKSLFLFSLEYNAGSCDDGNWAIENILIEIDYSLLSGEHIVVTKSLSFVSANEASNVLGWYPSIFTDNFIIFPYFCNLQSITKAVVKLTALTIIPNSCYSSISYDIYFNGDFIQNIGNGFSYTLEEIEMTEDQSALNFSVFPKAESPRPYHCGIGQTAHIAPYGGCPPYTITWSNSIGEIIDSYATELNYYDLYTAGCSLPTKTYISTDAINVFLNPNAPGTSYTVVVEDSNGNSLSQNYTFSSGIENEVSFSYVIEPYFEDNQINLKVSLTPASPSEGLLSFYPLNPILQNNDNDAVWWGTISNENGICFRFEQVFGNSLYGNIPNIPAGTYEIALFNAGVSCRTFITQEFSCEDLNLLCLSGNFFICDNSTTTLELTSMYIDLDNSTINWSDSQTGINLTVPASGGEYAVTVTDVNGKSTSKTFTVVIENAPIVDFESEGIEICLGEMITLNPIVSGVGGYTYLWDTGQTSETIDVTPSFNTIYFVTVTDTNGCFSSNSITVTLKPIPTTPSITGDLILCIGESTTLIASSGSSYLWSSGETTQSITVNPTANTIYSVTVYDAIGCSAANSITVTVNPLPTTSITGDLTLCVGESTTLTASGGINYLWQAGQTSQSITVSPTETTTYTVTVTDANYCIATYTNAVIVNPLPTPIITGNLSLCYGETGYIQALYGSVFLWETGQSTAGIYFFATENTTYTVTVTDPNGCEASVTATVTVYDPQVNIEIDEGSDYCTAILTATATGNGELTYTWSPSVEEPTPVITVNAPGTYTVIVTDDNGCTTTAEQIVTPADLENIFDFVGTYIVGTTPPLTDDDGDILNDIELWEDKTFRIAGTITIPAGKTLTIENTNLYLAGQTTTIVVKKGGILRIVNSAALQGDNCAANYWHGILVEADAAINHPNTENIEIVGSPNHGVVYVSGNSYIKDALIAIEDFNPPPVSGFDPPKGGGIIIIENNSVFENNLTGVKMNPYRPISGIERNLQRSRIVNSSFKNLQPFVGTAYSGYRYQIILNSVNQVPIEGNLFTANPAVLNQQAKGTGISTTNSGINIGIATDGTSATNNFVHLYKGIDVYNTLTAVSVTNIENNIFHEVTKALTLNNVPFAIVRNNSFLVPTGSSGDHDSYAVYTLNSFGFKMINNSFNTFTAANSDTHAAVIDNAYFSDPAIANIRQNTFTGGFTDATHFIKNCRSLQLNCNVYLNEPQSDWYIANGAELDAQGQCVVTKPELSYHQHWHSPSNIGYHVFNDNSNFILKLYHDDYQYSVPTDNEGYVEPYSCSFILGGNPIINSSCTIPYPPYGEGNEGCEYSGEELSRKIQDWQIAGEGDSIIALLHCVATDWAYKILVGTYIDRRMYPEALAILDSIPDTPQSNADFKSIYYAYIQLITGGSGKNSDAAFALHHIEQNQHDVRQTLAESMLAMLEGNNYVRSVAGLGTKTRHSKSHSVKLSLIPNPGGNSTTVKWVNKPDKADIKIYDMTGVLKMSYTHVYNGQLLDISTLPNGIYVVQSTVLLASEKLVIVK